LPNKVKAPRAEEMSIFLLDIFITVHPQP